MALVAAAIAAVVGVALQVHGGHDATHALGAVIAWLAWATFALDAVVMLRIHPAAREWARAHWFELAVLVVACPLWATIAYGLLAFELAPALTVLDATKLAKLVKAVRVLRGGAPRLLAGAVLAGAAVTGLAIVAH